MMKHGKLIVSISQLTEKQRGEIAARAMQYGLETLFFDDIGDAMPHAEEAEIFFGSAPEFTQTAKNLRWVCAPSAGVNQYMTPGALPGENVLLSNSSGAYGVTISEHIVMTTLEIMRRQQDYSTVVAERKWVRNLPVRSIKGSRITLLGTGDIGREAAVRLRAFSPACLIGVNRSGNSFGQLFDRIVRQEEMDSVLPETDLLIISLPGTKDTLHMIQQKRLALLPDGAMIVNVGRGSVIDQKALTKELAAGRLYAALDVFEEEPIPLGDPIWTSPNLLITPHVAGNMTLPYTVEKIVSLFLSDLDRYAQGLIPERLVDLSKGY